MKAESSRGPEIINEVISAIREVKELRRVVAEAPARLKAAEERLARLKVECRAYLLEEAP